MRKISERNKFPNFDLYNEYRKIECLLSEIKFIGGYNQFRKRMHPSLTFEQYVNDLYFLDWKLRGTFISVEEMRISLGIEKDKFTPETISADIILDFIQYAGNLSLRVAYTIKNCSFAYLSDDTVIDALIENMNALLEKLGAHFVIDDTTEEAFVAYDNDISAVVADRHPEIKRSIAEYNKIDSRGDLQRKGEILCTLFKRLEADERKFKGTTYEKLCSDTTFLFNKIGARHWVEKDKIASKTFLAMSPDELELWYDKTYALFLSCMVTSQYLDIKNEIEDIKRVE